MKDLQERTKEELIAEVMRLRRLQKVQSQYNQNLEQQVNISFNVLSDLSQKGEEVLRRNRKPEVQKFGEYAFQTARVNLEVLFKIGKKNITPDDLKGRARKSSPHPTGARITFTEKKEKIKRQSKEAFPNWLYFGEKKDEQEV